MIVNPNAGRKNGTEIARQVATRLNNAGITTEQIVSGHPGGTVEIAAALDPGAWDGILAVGGDGTFFEVLNGLLSHDEAIRMPIAPIPVGTGNSFARDLFVENVDDAVARIVSGRTRLVDLGKFTCDSGAFYFANLLGAGFVSNVAHRAVRFKRLGPLAYVIGVVGELVALRSSGIRLAIDDTILERDALFVEICNSRFTGGSMMMAPSAEIDDGLLDVVVVKRISRRTVLKLLPSIYTGTHVDHDAVEVFRGKHITLESDVPLALTPDGETFGTTPLQVSLLHHALEIFGP